MNFLSGKRILLGVTGGIAAYKAAELTRQLVKSGAEVRVVMTQGALAFVTPLTFQALSANPVRQELLDESAESGMSHIELARWADRILVAPASASFMARLANGIADDLLSTCCLASEAPVFLAPAMNRVMWEKPQTRRNTKLLKTDGVRLLGPAEGDHACGETGPGRMLEPDELALQIGRSFSSDLLAGLSVLVTAGPTREAIDAVRFISNRSSGKMGFAVANAAREAGAQVTLVTGPVGLETPDGVERINVETAQQMGQAVLDQINRHHILIGSAAVADYVPAVTHSKKIKKTGDTLSIELIPGIDIMESVGNLDKKPFTVGFAAETHNLEQHARDKKQRKNMNMIAANRVGVDDRGFDVDDNELLVMWQGGQEHLPLNHKGRLARQLIRLIGKQFFIENPRGNL